jgi:hypothetical protein
MSSQSLYRKSQILNMETDGVYKFSYQYHPVSQSSMVHGIDLTKVRVQ